MQTPSRLIDDKAIKTFLVNKGVPYHLADRKLPNTLAPVIDAELSTRKLKIFSDLGARCVFVPTALDRDLFLRKLLLMGGDGMGVTLLSLMFVLSNHGSMNVLPGYRIEALKSWLNASEPSEEQVLFTDSLLLDSRDEELKSLSKHFLEEWIKSGNVIVSVLKDRNVLTQILQEFPIVEHVYHNFV